jgi:hypothetical protein
MFLVTKVSFSRSGCCHTFVPVPVCGQAQTHVHAPHPDIVDDIIHSSSSPMMYHLRCLPPTKRRHAWGWLASWEASWHTHMKGSRCSAQRRRLHPQLRVVMAKTKLEVVARRVAWGRLLRGATTWYSATAEAVSFCLLIGRWPELASFLKSATPQFLAHDGAPLHA